VPTLPTITFLFKVKVTDGFNDKLSRAFTAFASGAVCLATDKDAETIPWVRVTNAQGQTTEYHTDDFKGDPSQHDIRRMDCLDCPSRPAHNVMAPNDAVDVAIATGRIDPKIPFAKAKVVTALTQPFASKPEALQAIATSLHAAYPDPAQADPTHCGSAGNLSQEFLPRDEDGLAHASQQHWTQRLEWLFPLS
jgi:hypothetical protein